MKTTTQALAIGGGVVGCSALCHLTELGWSGVMPVDRSELTSGSTWHAAGVFHTLNGDTNMAALQGYTIRPHRKLEEIVGPDEIQRIALIADTDGIVGALYDPLDRHLDPSGNPPCLCQGCPYGWGRDRDTVYGTRNASARRWQLGCGDRQGHHSRRVHRRCRRSLGAVWGAQYGLEVPNYFTEDGEPRFETPSFRRSNAWEATRREVMAVGDNVGIDETHDFGKYAVTGPGARDWLDRVMAGRVPKPGRVSLIPMLSPKGKSIGDL